MPFTIIRQDIVNMNTDAIVCATNSALYLDCGVALRVLETCTDRAGLLAECRRIGYLEVGCAAVVPSFGLDAKHIVFAVGPDCREYDEMPEILLYRAYISALTAADTAGDTSVALPFISTGAKGFPKDAALTVVRQAVKDFLETHDTDIYLVLYDGESFEIGKKRCGEIEDYLEEHGLPPSMPQYAMGNCAPCTAGEPSVTFETASKTPAVKRRETLFGSAKKLSADVILADVCDSCAAEPFIPCEDTFTERLFKLIDARGLKDPEVYKKANIDRKLFSKIRSDVNYKPKKSTALSLALALSLPLDETKDLLSRAGYALSKAIRADLIVMYYIERKQYDLYEINATLFYYGEQLLGA